MKTSDILQAARALIEDPERWTTGKLVNSRGAMCAFGAVNRIETGDPCEWPVGPEMAAHSLLNDAAVAHGEPEGSFWNSSAVNLNNTRGHAAVLEMFDIAISLALSDEAVSP